MRQVPRPKTCQNRPETPDQPVPGRGARVRLFPTVAARFKLDTAICILSSVEKKVGGCVCSDSGLLSQRVSAWWISCRFQPLTARIASKQSTHPSGRCPTCHMWQVLVNVVCFPHTTPPVVTRAHKKSFPGGAPPPQTPPIGRPLSRPPQARRAHGHRFGRPLSRPPKASVWGHVQDQPRSTCLVRMIWVKDQHAQHWPWTLSRWKQGGLAPLASICSGSMANAEHAGP